MTLDESIQGLRLRVLRRAQELGNAAQACREAGISRTLFYRWRKRHERYGADGVHPRRMRAARGRPSCVAPHDERQVLALAIAWPTWGPARLSNQLLQQSIKIAPSTVYRLLGRHQLGTRRERLAVLEHRSAREAGLLTERTREQLLRARIGAKTRHVQASTPGELVCIDSFYVGKLKGVGKVWQLTACDAATSFGLGLIVAAPTSADAARFLRDHLVPSYRDAGWTIQRVLTDGGSEFKASFDATCSALGIRHTRTKPRHCWTNGFVERLQGTILHEHWRVVFRRRYFTSRRQLQTSLDGFLRFYNELRPHQGYRLRGRTPAAAFQTTIA
jgi:transposase InsO family protein